MESASYIQAIALLETALAQYPGEETMDDLLRDARQGYKLQSRLKRVEEIVAQCRRQISEHNHQEALKVARAGIEEYPDEPRLTSIVAEIKASLAEIEKERAIRAALDSVSALEEQKEYEKGVQVLLLALEKNPSHPGLLDQLSSLKQKAERQRQVVAAVDRVCELMARGFFNEALENVESAMKSFPDEIAFSTLRADIDRSRRTEAVTRACRSIEGLIASGRLDEAADSVHNAFAEFGNDAAVDALRLRIEDELKKRERDRKIEALISDARRLLDQRPGEAVARIREGVAAYPDSIELKDLLARANQAITNRQRETEIRSLTGRARTLLDEGNPRDAKALLEEGVRRFPDAVSLADLLPQAKREVLAVEEREREEKVNRALALARSEDQAGRPLPAIRTLQEALRAFPANAAILSELERIQGAHPELVRKRASGLKVAAIAAILLLVIGSAAGVAYRLMNSGVKTDSGDNFPPPPPPAKLARIAAFTISPDSIAAGGKAQLCYEVQDAVTVTIVPALPDAKETDSRTCFEVAPADTTEYRLTAKNADGVEASDSRTIEVKTPVEELGALVVDAGQADVVIRVGNRPPERSGPNGIVEIRLKPGPYSVVAEKDGFQSAQENVQVVLGNKPKRVSFDLSREVPINLPEGTAATNLIAAPRPVYPTARGARGATTVTLQVIINKDGNVKDVTRINGSQPFVDAAIDAVKQSRYKPYVLNGKQHEVSTTVSVAFAEPPDNAPPPPPPPPPPPTTDCRRVLDGLKAANNQNGLENFIRGNECGKPPFSDEAQAHLNRLRDEEAERKAWSAANQESIESLQAYLNVYPAGPNANTAKNQIARLRDAAAKAADQRRRDTEAITSILRDYASAYKDKSFTKISAVYPNANKRTYEDGFWKNVNRYSRYDITIPASGPVFSSDDNARITCQVTGEMVAGNDRQPVKEQITFTLNRDRTKGTWSITSATHQSIASATNQ
jgi:outer membrane biosynthesis protein TonB